MSFTCKTSIIMSLPGGGSYSETYYSTENTIAAAKAKALAYASFRREWLCHGGIVKGVRVSTVGLARQADSSETDYPATYGPGAENDRDLANAGALIKLYAGNYSSRRCYRGFPDSFLKWGDNGEDILSPFMVNFLDALKAKVMELGYGIRVISRSNADRLPKFITAVTVSNNVLQSVTAPGALFAEGEQCQIAKCKGPGANRVNGVYTVTAFTAGPPEVVGVSPKLIQNLLYTPGTGIIFHRVPDTQPITDVAFQRPSTRKISNRAPFVPAGRRRRT